jgi:hypothetical protein
MINANAIRHNQSGSALYVAVCLALLSFAPASAQSKKADWSITGMAAVLYDGNSAYFTLGGPSISVKSGRFQAGVNMLPSLRYQRDEKSNSREIIPTLGTGLTIGYAKVCLLLGFYYYPSTSSWRFATGVGFRFKN